MININDQTNKKLLELCSSEVELYIVGGYIRDILLQKECFDRDYVIKGQSAVEFARHAAKLFDGYFVLLDEKHDIARVVMPDKKNTLDFAGCVGQDIYTDLKNRDYTINAVGCRVESDNCSIIDPLNGREDIKNGIIRLISEKNLLNDPIRLLRAFRLAAQFNFKIEENTLESIKKHHKLINNIAAERINTELLKLFESENSAENLIFMKETGILFEIIPELIPQKDVPPNLHHHLCLIDHSIEVVRQVETQIKSFPDWAIEHLYSFFSTNIKRISLFKTAALLHDLGKPSTWSIDEEGRHRFIKHEEVGAEQCLELLKRIKFSKNAINYISLLIKNHLYPSQLIREGMENVSEKALMRFFRKISDNTPDLLLLALSDRLSARGPDITEELVEKNVSGIYTLLQKYKEAGEDIKNLPKLISGKEVMELLAIPRGKQVGNVLKALKEEQISGNINTKEEALDFVNRHRM
ncbi:MAG TPA: HD domain-containing protein [Candidatus Gastranaerophilales bacterium]|nr:HD domain-containing protein [Candidatus Gastranaerophilales bacterium]